MLTRHDDTNGLGVPREALHFVFSAVYVELPSTAG